MTTEKKNDFIGIATKYGTFILICAAVATLAWNVFAVPQIDVRANTITDKKTEAVVIRNDKDHDRIMDRLDQIEKSLSRLEGRFGTNPKPSLMGMVYEK